MEAEYFYQSIPKLLKLTAAAMIIWALVAISVFVKYQNTHANDRVQYFRHEASLQKSAQTPCPLFTKTDGFSDWIACISKKIVQTQDTTEQDLYLRTQQDMAEWNFGSFLVSVFGFLLSGGSLIALLASLRYTQISLKQTKEANEISSTIGQAQVRAYIAIEDISIAINNSKNLGISISVKNTGQSPATFLEACFQYRVTNSSNEAKSSSIYRVLPDISANQVFNEPMTFDIDETFDFIELGDSIFVTLECAVFAKDVFDKEIIATVAPGTLSVLSLARNLEYPLQVSRTAHLPKDARDKMIADMREIRSANS